MLLWLTVTHCFSMMEPICAVPCRTSTAHLTSSIGRFCKQFWVAPSVLIVLLKPQYLSSDQPCAHGGHQRLPHWCVSSSHCDHLSSWTNGMGFSSKMCNLNQNLFSFFFRSPCSHSVEIFPDQSLTQ